MTGGFSNYWAMGGYAGFVWPAYGLSAVVMAGLAVSVFGGLKAREKTLRTLRRRSGRGAGGREAPRHDP